VTTTYTGEPSHGAQLAAELGKGRNSSRCPNDRAAHNRWPIQRQQVPDHWHRSGRSRRMTRLDAGSRRRADQELPRPNAPNRAM